MKFVFQFSFFCWMIFGLIRCTNPEAISTIDLVTLNSRVETSFRGIASLDADKVWVSGTQGMVLHSKDGGQSWMRVNLPEADSLDFRDLEILNTNTLLLMSIGNGEDSRIYKTEDSGQNWRTVLINQKEKAFFNGFDFWNEQSGVLVSDPIDEKLYLLKTDNGGESWNRIGTKSLPSLNSTEYGFAASGTGVFTLGRNHIWIATGGDKARVFRSSNGGTSWIAHTTPMASGNASSGIFSISFRDSLYGIAVGGDYQNPEAKVVALIRTTDGGKTWKAIQGENTIGHKACVQYLGEKMYLVAGRTGVIWSKDDGLTWNKISTDPYYSISYDQSSKVGYLAGPGGSIARFEISLK